MNDNLELYNRVREVPEKAKKRITGGRMKGLTDINPMWRIKKLTEIFGAAGFGWYYDIKKMWLERGANEVISAFVEIDLHVKVGDEWSKPIVGVGGNSFVAKENNGLYTSDECYKMALTDALSVACKALGVGADVYFERDVTKYTTPGARETQVTPKKPPVYACTDCGKPFEAFKDKNGEEWSAERAYRMSQSKNKDKKARCKVCRTKCQATNAETDQGGENN